MLGIQMIRWSVLSGMVVALTSAVPCAASVSAGQLSAPPAEKADDKPADREQKQEQDQGDGGKTTIFMVVPAEPDTIPRNDPQLSYVGRNRARGLRDALRSVTLSEIYVSEFRVASETATMLAKANGIETKYIGGPDLPKLVKALKTKHAGQAVLVVRSLDEIMLLLKQLGIKERKLPNIHPRSHDDLLIVTIEREGSATLLHLHYKKLTPR